MKVNLLDAQVAVAFLMPQLTHIEREVYAIEYPEIRYPGLVPVDTTANEWTSSVTYMSLDATGRAEWYAGRAQDVPNANVLRAKYETPVKMASIGYEFDLEEISIAALAGQNLQIDKADAARNAAERFLDQRAMFGDLAVGFYGLVNNPNVPVGTVTPGAGGGTTFASKTPDEILSDFNGGLSGIWLGSNNVELADTVLMPDDIHLLLSTRRLGGDNNSMTVLEWIERNNAYTKRTRRPLTIEAVRGLKTAGAGGLARMVIYRRDPRVVKMHVPMPFRFLRNPWQIGPIAWHVPGIFRFGGVDVRRPGAFRYVDGI